MNYFISIIIIITIIAIIIIVLQLYVLIFLLKLYYNEIVNHFDYFMVIYVIFNAIMELF